MDKEKELLKYKKDFYQEYSSIDFFVKTLEEVKSQINFYGSLCKKEYDILYKGAEKTLINLQSLESNIIKYKDDPSNLYLIQKELIQIMHIHYSAYKQYYPECLKAIGTKYQNISKELEEDKNIFLVNSLKKLAKGDKTEIKQYLHDSINGVMKNTFKGLLYFHSLIILYAEQKQNLYTNIKNDIETKISQEEINIVINDIQERQYAENKKQIYEPIHFGNSEFKIIETLKTDVLEKSNSILLYNKMFLECICMRWNLLNELKKFLENTKSINEEMDLQLKHVCEKINTKAKKFSITNSATSNTWNLILSSWNSIYSANKSYMQIRVQLCPDKITKHLNFSKEEVENFSKKWKTYKDEISKYREKYKKYKNLKNKNDEKKKEMKSTEAKLRSKMNKCSEFLDEYIPPLRKNELNRVNEVKDIGDKFKDYVNKNLDEFIENTKNELENAENLETFDAIQSIFETKLESLGIENIENFMDNLREDIERNQEGILDDKELIGSVRESILKIVENDNSSWMEPKNPFKNSTMENEQNNIDDDFDTNENEIYESAKKNEFNNDKPKVSNSTKKIFNLNNQITSSLREGNIDNNEDTESKEISYGSKKNKSSEFSEKEVVSENSTPKNLKNNINAVNISNISMDIDSVNEEKKQKIEDKKIVIQENQNLYYGILCLLGVFCLKSLFSSKTFFSIDSLINVAILGIIMYVMYKTQIQN